MVASQLYHQISVLLKRPRTHYWTSPLKFGKYSNSGQVPPPPFIFMIYIVILAHKKQNSWREDVRSGEKLA